MIIRALFCFILTITLTTERYTKMHISAVYRKQWSRVQRVICSLEQKLWNFSVVQETRGLHNVEPTIRSLWKPKNQTMHPAHKKAEGLRKVNCWDMWILFLIHQSHMQSPMDKSSPIQLFIETFTRTWHLSPSLFGQEILKTGKPYISFAWWRALTHLCEIFAMTEMASSLW